MSKKVFVLQNSWHADDCGNDFGIVGIYTTKERAVEEMEKCIAEEIKNNDDLFLDGEPREGVIVENGEFSPSWCAFREGEYLLCSCEYKITEEYIYD